MPQTARQFNVADPDARDELAAWLSEHADDEFKDVAVPFIRWVTRQPPDTVKDIGEALIAVSMMARADESSSEDS